MTEKRHIYLDNSATTKISREALDKYVEVSEACYGNPSSLHSYGLLAEKEITAAKEEILKSIGDKNSSVIFTASGSEANNLAIFGRAFAKERYKRGSKIITTSGEHASVSLPTDALSKLGFKVVNIPTVGGALDIDTLTREMTGDVILVTMMMVNNETGALYDIKKVSDIMHRASPEAVLHIDATQSYMKVRFTKASIGADMITLSSHKIEGPKGVGALVVDGKILKNRGITPMILGGGQELGLRSGTENVPGIAAFGVAVRRAYSELDARIEKTEDLRNYLIEKLSKTPELSEITVTDPKRHAPHILNITLPSIKSETMLHYLSSLGIYVSSGSACSSNSAAHISSALIAYGKSEKDADSSIRISLSHNNTKEDIDAFTEALASGISRLARIKR